MYLCCGKNTRISEKGVLLKRWSWGHHGKNGIVEMAITLAIVAVLLSRGVIKDTEKDLGPGIKGAIDTVTHPTTETLTGEVRALKEQLIKLQSAKQTA